MNKFSFVQVLTYCEILFTGDVNSTSSKMAKAKKLGIEIREY